MLLLIVLFLPLAAALLTYVAGNRYAGKVALGLSVVELGASLALLPAYNNADAFNISFMKEWIQNPHINFHIALDGLSLLLLLLTTFLVPVIILSSVSKEVENARSLYALILLMQFALIGVFISMDGFLYYIFWELALIPIYFIALLWGDNRDKEFRNRAIFKFFVYTLAGSLFMLLGFIYLYQHADGFGVSELYGLNLSDKEQSFLFWAFFVAFAIKIPVFPFHTWQPDTYKEAPSAGTMLLSGIMLKMGIYSLLRWLLPVLPQGTLTWTPVVLVLCAIGIIYGSVIAIRQNDLKKLFAYSSLAHVGLITAGIFTLTREGFQGAVVQMLAHGVNVVGLFFAAEIIFRRTGTLEISKLGGIRNVAPVFATALMILTLASVGLPTTNGFIGEFLLLYGVYEYNTWLAVVAGLTIILGAVYMLRMYQHVMLGETKEATHSFSDLSLSELAVFVPLIVAIFLFGVYPKPIMQLAQPALETILNYSLR
ncbi:MAG: NADH-quinone oxidoreductase subunit M [Chitinophagales bacterium]|nr:NADH-quinone oxidoreductase subunit M [Chitinophagales bacterium]